MKVQMHRMTPIGASLVTLRHMNLALWNSSKSPWQSKLGNIMQAYMLLVAVHVWWMKIKTLRPTLSANV